MSRNRTLQNLVAILALVALFAPMTAGAAPSIGNSVGRASLSAQDQGVVPELPTVVQPTCTADGQQTAADLTLPPDTDNITYSIQSGTVAPGEQVVVRAQLADTAAWDLDHWPDRWVHNSDVDALFVIDFDDPDCDSLDVVVPEPPGVDQPVCMQDGRVTDPDLTLPQDTDDITYSIQSGTVAPGEQVVVRAQLAGTAAWDLDPGHWQGGWFANSDVDALLVIDFDDPDCDPLGVVAPESPVVTQPVCMQTDPALTLPQDTEAITYSLQGDVAPGNTVTVIATLADDYQWATSAGMWTFGWNMDSDTTASFEVTFDDPDCDSQGVVVPELPVVDQPVCMQDGRVTDPDLALPQDTADIIYSIQSGTVAPGKEVVVQAQLAGTAAWDLNPDHWQGGWFANSDVDALLVIDFDDPDCASIVDVVPENPTIGQPACTDKGDITDPTIAFAPTTGVTYTLVGDVVPGGTVTVVATLADNHAWNTTAGMWPTGWAVNPDNEREATAVFEFDNPECTTPHEKDKPEGPAHITALPSTGSGDLPMPSSGMTMLLATLAAVSATVATWIRRESAR